MNNLNRVRPVQTTAFFVQSGVSFAVAGVGMLLGIAYLPMSGWPRAFLALGALYLVTSTFTLAKCVRDQQESSTILSRMDEARLQKLLAENDPITRPVI